MEQSRNMIRNRSKNRHERLGSTVFWRKKKDFIIGFKVNYAKLAWNMLRDFHRKINWWFLEENVTEIHLGNFNLPSLFTSFDPFHRNATFYVFSWTEIFDEDTGESTFLAGNGHFYYWRPHMILVDHDFCQFK